MSRFAPPYPTYFELVISNLRMFLGTLWFNDSSKEFGIEDF